jgi:hypothetical protein
MKKPIPPTGNRRPTATIDLKAEEIQKDKPAAMDTAGAGDQAAAPADKDATAAPAADAAKPAAPGARLGGDKTPTADGKPGGGKIGRAHV